MCKLMYIFGVTLYNGVIWSYSVRDIFLRVIVDDLFGDSTDAVNAICPKLCKSGVSY